MHTTYLLGAATTSAATLYSCFFFQWQVEKTPFINERCECSVRVLCMNVWMCEREPITTTTTNTTLNDRVYAIVISHSNHNDWGKSSKIHRQWRKSTEKWTKKNRINIFYFDMDKKQKIPLDGEYGSMNDDDESPCDYNNILFWRFLELCL